MQQQEQQQQQQQEQQEQQQRRRRQQQQQQQDSNISNSSCANATMAWTTAKQLCSTTTRISAAYLANKSSREAARRQGYQCRGRKEGDWLLFASALL